MLAWQCHYKEYLANNNNNNNKSYLKPFSSNMLELSSNLIIKWLKNKIMFVLNVA